MKIRFSSRWVPLIALVFLSVASSSTYAQDSKFEIGLNGLIILSQGQPSNDMIGFGLVGRWALKEDWYLGVAIDSVEFDFEKPYLALGIQSTTVVDPINDFSRYSFFVEKRYDRPNHAWDWFWTAGVGFASIDVGPNAMGAIPGGGTYNISVIADDEVHLMVGGGLRREFGENWSLQTSLTVQQHSTDYRLVDLVSSTTGSIGSHTPYGITIGLNYGF